MSEVVDVLIVKQAREELKQTIQDMVKLNGQIVQISNNIAKFSGKPLTNPIPSELPKRAEESSKWISQLNASNKEAERLATSVARSKAKLAAAETQNSKALAKLRLETQLNNKALKDEAVLSSKLVGAYQKLSVRRNQAASTLKNLIASEKASNREIRKAQREFDRLDAKIKKADRATNDFRKNVGNYGSAFGKARLALRSFIGALGIYSGFQIAQEVFEQVKAINGLNLALQQVTETTELYNSSQAFLSDLAEEAGTDIFSLTRAYTKFLAAAKTTNLTLAQTNNIFRQVAKAGGVLGLTTDDINGAFRALEQILSKGKVQAEEIRGQLGERLPGAFQILAKSMELTTAELSKQLELGNVLSDEVLPGFARELEKTYNLQLVERVETLAASQTRLGNAWKQFLANVEGGEGAISRVFKSMLDGVTELVKFFDGLNENQEEVRESYLKGLESNRMKEELTDLKIEAIKTGKALEDVALSKYAKYKNEVAESEVRVKTLKEEMQDLSTIIKELYRNEGTQQRMLKKSTEALQEEEKRLAIKQGRLQAVNKILFKSSGETKKLTKETKDLDNETSNYGKTLKDLTPRLEKVFAIMKGSTGDETEKIKKEVAEITEILNSSGGNINVGIDGLEVLDPEEITQALLKKIKEAYKKINDTTSISAEEQEDIFKGVFDTFSEYYNLDLTSFQKLLQGKKTSLDDFASTAKSIAGAISDSAVIRFENERAANQEKLDAILNDDRASEEQKKIAQEKFEKEDKALRIKQAKADRTAALVQIAIDTAAGIAKAVSASPLTFGLPFSAIVASVGAAQAAVVASQPLPRFKDGVENFKGGLAMVNDASGSNYKEIIETPDGNMYMPRGRNVVADLPKGSNVFTAQDSQEMLKNGFAKSNARNQEMIDLWLVRKATPSISTKGIEAVLQKELSKQSKRPITVNVQIPEPYNAY